MAIDHFMMFGTFAEQRHFVYPQEDTYSGVIFNANMVAHAPSGLAGFLVSRTNRLPYLIDPLTHAFQHATSVVLKDDGSEPKKAMNTLAQAYGEPFQSNIGIASLVPEDFQDVNLRKQVAERCLKFQREEVTSRAKAHEDCKYFSDDELKDFVPLALVAPYFLITENDFGPWLALNCGLASDAASVKIRGETLYAEIVISKGLLLSPAHIDELVKGYGSCDVQGYLLWVDEFDEHQASQPELQGFLSLCRGLRKSGRKLVNLHGGYFSVLAAGTLGDGALTGVTHGPEFGESRSVVPVGGGLPFAKYYLPILHERVLYRNMLAILQAKGWNKDAQVFFENVCNCDCCHEVIGNDIANFAKYGESTPLERKTKNGIVRIDYPTQDARLRCLKHFLQCKVKEFSEAEGERETLLAGIQRGVDELGKVLGYEGVKHLLNWKAVFSLGPGQ